jgi:hypothetical protein
LLWLLLCSLWLVGGWLIGANIFRLKQRERLFSGVALGWLLFIVFSNLLAQVVPVQPAFWGASLAVLGLGALGSVKHFHKPGRQEWLEILQQSLLLLGLLALFTLINRGLAIFDDYHNLPLVSRLAAGDIPPHLYVNTSQRLDYHYGLHLLAASLVRIGGFYPWSAFDLIKALAIALTPLLGWCWMRRYTHHRGLLVLGAGLVLFASGARWLLLLIPTNILNALSADLVMLGSAAQTAPSLSAALSAAWNIEGVGGFPFAFAFINGMFPPVSMGMAGNGAIPQMTLLLLLILARRKWTALPAIIFGLLISSLALTAEHIFLILYAGIGLALLFGIWQNRRRLKEFWRSELVDWVYILLPGALLSLVAGGVLTELFLKRFAALTGAALPGSLSFAREMSVQSPPGLISAHLGRLALTDPGLVLIGLFEIGPILLLVPVLLLLSWKRLRAGNWFLSGLFLAALIGFLLSLLVHLDPNDRNISRLAGSSFFIWLALGIPLLGLWFNDRQNRSRPESTAEKPFFRYFVAFCCALLLTGGLAMFVTQMTAINHVQLSDFIQAPDVVMTQRYWDLLEPDARILEVGFPSRAATIFARSLGVVKVSMIDKTPEYVELISNPDPTLAANAGFTHIYMDRETWQSLSPAQKQALQKPCVQKMAETKDPSGDFRRLFNVKACQKQPE